MNLTTAVLDARNAAIKRLTNRPRRLVTSLGNKLASDGPSAATLSTDDKSMVASFVISVPARDRGGDEVNPLGCILTNYATNPVWLFGHGMQLTWPIGMSREKIGGELWVYPEQNRVTAKCKFSQSCPEGKQFYGMVREGTLNTTSIGFDPRNVVKLKPLRDGEPNAVELVGYGIDKWELLEISLVPVPMCAGATRLNSWQADRIATILSRGRYEGEPLGAPMVKALSPFAAPKKGLVVSGWAPPVRRTIKAPAGVKHYNEAFDVDQNAEPSATIYGWISKYLNCRIRDICQSSVNVPHVRAGSLLSGFKNTLSTFEQKAVRNFHRDGTESPPRYKTIQLNSKLSDDFLIDGMGFYQKDATRIVVEYAQHWGGFELTFYAKMVDKPAVADVITKSFAWATANNFLKGEAFSLSGEFLNRTAESWNDVFLEEHNKKSLQRVIDQFNSKQKSFANRGMILTGPPGTGKTLSGRIVRNIAKGSFIWISAKDFMEFGSSGGMSFAFELAKELAPAILFMEDVDNWLRETTIDLIKTEMDGISRSTGVLTVLTTNFPERLPDALIDRPGRFHDVLKFDVPSESARRQMLTKWLGEFPKAEIEKAVADLNGYSGAHVWEVAQFVRTLKESDDLEPGAAITEALTKIHAQRELINELQLNGAHYDRRRKAYFSHWSKNMDSPINDRVANDQQKAEDVQCVKLSKDKFPVEDQAKAYCEEKGFKTDMPEHDEKSWNYKQFDEKELDGEKTEKPGDDGVTLVTGKRKTAGNPPDETNIDDEKPEPESNLIPRKAGDVWIETLTAHLNAVLDMLDDTEATQERPDILETAPTIQQMVADIAAVVEELSGASTPVSSDDPPEEKDDDEETKAKRLIAAWAKTKSNVSNNADVEALLGFLGKIYGTGQPSTLDRSTKAELKRLYKAARQAIANSPAELDVGKLVAQALANELKPLKEEVSSITGKA